MNDREMSDEYIYDWLKRCQTTRGSQTVKEAHEKLLAAGYIYQPEEACYYPPTVLASIPVAGE